ncbi:unnamed protein product [Adineta ricciae]|uniref:Uncharacterized protein n=1 Tax=Adineta ricciae TaxID=249248 RepID=A0A813P9A0_ADIRI|nr:unnamed protein product [Adineta ricciae]
MRQKSRRKYGVFDSKISINVSDLNEKNEENNFLKNKVSILDIGQLFEAIKQEKSSRSLSYFCIPWRVADLILKVVGGVRGKSYNNWGTILVEEDLEEFSEDNRGRKHDLSFYDIYLELENLVKLYALDACKRKAASFTSSELAGYLDEQYYDLVGQKLLSRQSFIAD